MEPLNHYAQSHCDLPFRSAISGDWATPGMVPAEGFFYSRVSLLRFHHFVSGVFFQRRLTTFKNKANER